MLGMFARIAGRIGRASAAIRYASADGPVLRALHPAHLFAHGLEAAAPNARPGQAGDEQDQRQAGDPEAGDGVHIPPEGLAAAGV